MDECSGNEHFTLNTIPAGQINYKIIILKSSTLQRACRIFYFMNTLFANHIHVRIPKNLLRGDYIIDDRGKHGTSGFKGEWLRFGSQEFPNWESVLEYLQV